MAKKFSEYVARLRGTMITEAVKSSGSWFRSALKKLANKTAEWIGPHPKGHGFYTRNSVTASDIGKMFIFVYDAKYKDTLPYWDAYPLIFLFGVEKDRFFGLNLHYLPPSRRAQFMDILVANFKLTDGQFTDPKTKLVNFVYPSIKAISKTKYYKACIHQYLKNHVKSSFLLVTPDSWENAIMLQTERFQKKTKYEVWKDSIDKMGK
jgi:hypothetical protein